MRYKRFLSLLLTFSMCLQLLNTPAIAATLELDRALEGQAEVQGEDGLEVQPVDVAEDQGEDEPEGQNETKGEDEAKGEDEPQGQPEGEPQTQPKDKADGEMGAQSEDKTGAVARIGSNTYDSLDDAVKAAQDGDTIELIADDQSDTSITIDKQITLDFGTSTYRSTSSDPAIRITGTGKLTLRGQTTSDEEENLNSGIVTEDPNERAIWNDGVLDVQSGTIKAARCAIYNSYDGKATLSGGFVSAGLSNNNSETPTEYAVLSSGELDVPNDSSVFVYGVHGGLAVDCRNATINGGTFTAEYYSGLYVMDNQDYAASEYKNATVSITGGKFTSDYGTAVKADSESSSTLTISGGNFSTSPSAWLADGCAAGRTLDDVYYVGAIVDDIEGQTAAIEASGGHTFNVRFTYDDNCSFDGSGEPILEVGKLTKLLSAHDAIKGEETVVTIGYQGVYVGSPYEGTAEYKGQLLVSANGITVAIEGVEKGNYTYGDVSPLVNFRVGVRDLPSHELGSLVAHTAHDDLNYYNDVYTIKGTDEDPYVEVVGDLAAASGTLMFKMLSHSSDAVAAQVYFDDGVKKVNFYDKLDDAFVPSTWKTIEPREYTVIMLQDVELESTLELEMSDDKITFDLNGFTLKPEAGYHEEPTFRFTSGTFYSASEVQMILEDSSGGKGRILGDIGIELEDATLTLNGGTINTRLVSVNVVDEGYLYVNGATLNDPDWEDWPSSHYGIYSDSDDALIIIEGGVVSGKDAAIYAKGDMIMKGGKIVSPATAVYNNGTNTFYFLGGITEGEVKPNADLFWAEGGSFSLDPAAFVARGYASMWNSSSKYYEVGPGHVVTFHANGGEGIDYTQTVIRGYPTALTPNRFTNDTMAFAGWNEKADGSGASYADGETITRDGEASDLFAQWSEPTVAVYDGDTLLGIYNSLANAVDAAEDGQIVRLLGNMTLSEGVTVPEGKDITLDLAGFDLSGNVQGALLTNNGTLTIEGHDELDSPSHVYHQNGSDEQAHALQNTGTLIINGGVYGDADDDDTNANTVNGGSALYNVSYTASDIASATAHLNGGRFTSGDRSSLSETFVIFNDGGKLDISSSKLHGKGIGAVINVSSADDPGVVRINGDSDSAWSFVGCEGSETARNVFFSLETGKIEATNLNIVVSGNYQSAFYLPPASEFTTTGGRIEHDGSGPLVLLEGQYEKVSNLQIDGTALVGNTSATLFELHGGNLGLSNASVVQNGGGYILHQTSGEATVTGGSYSFTGNGVMIMQENGLLTATEGASFEHKGNGTVLEQVDGYANLVNSSFALAGDGELILHEGHAMAEISGGSFTHNGSGPLIRQGEGADSAVIIIENWHATVSHHNADGSLICQEGEKTRVDISGDDTLVQIAGDAEGAIILQGGTGPIVNINGGTYEVTKGDNVSFVKQVANDAALGITGGIFRGFAPFVSGTPVNVQITGGKYFVDEDEAKKISDLCQQGHALRYNEDDECYEIAEGYYIVFYPNGGEGGNKYQYVDSDGAATLEANTFTKENDEFHCWNTREGGGGEDYEDQQEVSLSDNLELYAQWENSGKIVAAVYDGDTLLNSYETLAGAIEAAEEGQTVKLLKDVTLSEGVTVPEGKDISLDLAGYNLFGSVSGPLLTNNGTLTIDGHGYYAEDDDGSKKPSHVYNTNISSTDNLAVYNTGTLTINGGVYGDADDNDENANHVNRGSTLCNDGGTATLNGGRFTACDDNWTEDKDSPEYATYVLTNINGGLFVIEESMLYGVNISAINNILNKSESQLSHVIIDVKGEHSYENMRDRGEWHFNNNQQEEPEVRLNDRPVFNNHGRIDIEHLNFRFNNPIANRQAAVFHNVGENAELNINGGRFNFVGKLIELWGALPLKTKIKAGLFMGAGVLSAVGLGILIKYLVSGKGAKPSDDGYDIQDGHNIIYHPNGGEGDDKIQFVESDDATLEKNTFTMEDGEFVDWCTEPDGDDGDHYSDGQKVHLEKGETLELYAQWTGYAVSVTHEGETKNYKRLGDALDETKSGDTVKLLRDIDLGSNWVPRGIKGITFDGNEKTVTYHIEDNADSYRGGLFSTVSGTTAISKLNINATIIAHGDDAVAGGLYAQEGENANVTVQDVSIEGHIDVSSCSGGVIGMHRSGSLTLKNVKSNVDSMSTDGCAGGILGKGGEDLTALSFSSCSNECYVIGNVAGAICGDLAWHKNKTTETGWAVCTEPSFGYEDCSNSGKIEGTTRSGMVLCEQKADFPTDNTAYDPVLHNFAYLAHQLSYAYYNNFDLEGEHTAANKQVTFKKDKSPLAENDHFNDNTLVPESITIEWFASEDEVRESDYVCYIKLADNSYLAYSSLIGAEMTCLNANEGHTIVLLKDCEEDVNGFLSQKWNGDRSYYENWRKKTLVVTLDKNGHSYPYESFMCGDVAVFVVSGGIAEVRNGDEVVGTYGTLASAVAAAQGSGYTVVMLDNLRLHAGVDVSGTVELELNGKKISNADSLEGDYLLAVLHQGDLTINDSSEGGTGAISMSKAACAIKMTKRAADVTADPPYTAALEVNGGIIEGYNYAIAGNGEDGRGNTVVSINGGTIRATAPQGTKDVAAIYQPQKGVLWLHGGVVSGLTGVEIRAGSMGIPEDSTVVIEGTGSPASVEANAGGATTIGAGVAIAQHTTEKPIDVTIAGGSISGAWALSVANPQEIEDGGADTSVQLVVSGGTFKGTGEGGKALSVTDERVHGFVTGGKFSEQVPWACCEENYGPVTVPDGEGWYTVELLPEDVHYAVNLTLRDGIAVNYYIKDVTPEEIHKYRVAYSYVNEDGQTVEMEHQYSEEDLYNESDYRFKMLDLYSWQMGWEIKIKMYYGSVESNEYTYSVRQYLENQIARYGDDPEKAEFVDLCKAMLDYGAAAQKYFDGRTYIDEAGITHHYRTDVDHLVNAKTNPENIINADKPSEKYDVSVVGTITGVEYYGASLVLGSSTAIRIFVTGEVGDTVVASCLDSRGNARACSSLVRSGNRNYFEVRGIKCHELDMTYTIEIIKGKEAITVTYSPYTYARDRWESTDAVTQQLSHALVAYGDKASKWAY